MFSRPMPPSRFWPALLVIIALAICVFALAFPRPSDAQALTAGPVLKAPIAVSPISTNPISVSRKPAPPPEAGTLSPYTDPFQFLGVPFGSHSHWAQPWRAYLETVPAATFLDGIGVNMGTGDPAAVVPALASKGVRRIRYEESWCNVDWADESLLDNAGAFRAFLQYCRQYGIRPLILLNAHQGAPGPVRMFTRTLAGDAQAGDTSVTLTDASGLVPGHSGLSNLTDYWAAEDVVTGIDGNTVTLSKPLPYGIPAGSAVPMATLKYLPFTAAGSAEYDATVAGWQRYVLTVARFARSELGPGGFDLEVWNELTFGSDFLDAGNYGLPPGPDMWTNLVAATADLTQNSELTHSDPALFAGVGIGDGFANTIPWPAASDMPRGVTAIDKHPYSGRKTYPQDNAQGITLNALSQPDGYVPSYTEHFPEYFGSALQTEFIERDCSPFTDASFSYAGIHGRDVRPGDPCPGWITEYRLDPDAGGAADEILKSILRFYCFWLNKGVTQADWFNSDDLLAQPQALDALSRICAVMRQGLDRNAAARSLMLLSVSDTHGHAQFQGDGTAAHPDLLDRDVFAFLPYQVNAHRFVVPYYVMTRDVHSDLPAEAFTLKLSGLGPWALIAESLDPTTGRATLLPITRSGAQSQITVSATDRPQLLILDDSLWGQLVDLFSNSYGGR